MSTRARLDAGHGMVAWRHGDGDEPVLWIHGYTMDARIWDDLWSRLRGWQHIGLDLPGHGFSAPGTGALDLAGLARQIGEFAQRLGVRHLVGLSFGGMVALQVAIEFPGLFASMALGSPALGGGPQDRRAQALNLELTRAHRERGVGPWLTDLWATPASFIFAGAAKQPELWARLRAIVSDHGWPELGDGRMQRLATHRQPDAALARIGAPALVLVGDEDAEAFKRSAELIRRSVPRCRRVHLAGAGHLGLIERADTTAPLLDAHFRAAGCECAHVA